MLDVQAPESMASPFGDSKEGTTAYSKLRRLWKANDAFRSRYLFDSHGESPFLIADERR